MLLNSALRSTIKYNALKTILDREIAMEKREHALALRCYNAALPVNVRNALAKVDELSPNVKWFNTNRQAGFNVAGQRMTFHTGENTRVPHNYWAHTNSIGKAITLEDNEKLVNEVRAWQDESEKLKAERKTAEKTLDVLLKSVRTTESLFKVWPEGKKFYSSPPLPAGQPSHLPAVQMDMLNKMLGLNTSN
jgi:hypothetical protein